MTGNYLLTVGALALLSILILSTNNSIQNNDISITESKIIITGTSLGQTLIDEIRSKVFDEAEISGSVSSESDLSSSLGPDGGENFTMPDSAVSNTFLSASNYNDIDDYNGYIRIVDTPNAENFTLTCSVTYAELSNPDVSAGSKSYCKKVTVTVTSPFFSSIPSIVLKYAFTY